MHLKKYVFLSVLFYNADMFYIVDVFKEIEIDLVEEVMKSGIYNFSSLLFEYDIISHNEMNLIGWLSENLSPDRLTLVLVEILANKVKKPVMYKAFLYFLEKVSSLHYLHNKVEVLLGQ